MVIQILLNRFITIAELLTTVFVRCLVPSCPSCCGSHVGLVYFPVLMPTLCINITFMAVCCLSSFTVVFYICVSSWWTVALVFMLYFLFFYLYLCVERKRACFCVSAISFITVICIDLIIFPSSTYLPAQ